MNASGAEPIGSSNDGDRRSGPAEVECPKARCARVARCGSAASAPVFSTGPGAAAASDVPSPGATAFTLGARWCAAPVGCGVATDPAPPASSARLAEVFTATAFNAVVPAAVRAAVRTLLRAAISVSTASAVCRTPANLGSATSPERTGRRSVAGTEPDPCPASHPVARAPLESPAATRIAGETAAIRPTPGIARDSTVIRKSPIRIGPWLRPGDSNHSGSVESDSWSVAAELIVLNAARTSRTREFLASPVPPHAMPQYDVQLPQRSPAETHRRPQRARTTPAEKASRPGRKRNPPATQQFAKCGSLVTSRLSSSRSAASARRFSPPARARTAALSGSRDRRFC